MAMDSSDIIDKFAAADGITRDEEVAELSRLAGRTNIEILDSTLANLARMELLVQQQRTKIHFMCQEGINARDPVVKNLYFRAIRNLFPLSK